MNISSQNIALFIKRAEEYQTQQFIIDAFASNHIGEVSELLFIPKTNSTTTTKPYNGVVVQFQRFYMNTFVQTLIDEMIRSPDGTTRFYFQTNRYWIINIHKPPPTTPTPIGPPPSPTLEQSTTLQSYYITQINQANVLKIKEQELKQTHLILINQELTAQLEEKEWDNQIQQDILKQEIRRLREENQTLRTALHPDSTLRYTDGHQYRNQDQDQDRNQDQD
jgi:hypothetical protein